MWSDLWEVLRKMGVPVHLVALIKILWKFTRQHRNPLTLKRVSGSAACCRPSYLTCMESMSSGGHVRIGMVDCNFGGEHNLQSTIRGWYHPSGLHRNWIMRITTQVEEETVYNVIDYIDCAMKHVVTCEISRSTISKQQIFGSHQVGYPCPMVIDRPTDRDL